MSPRKAPRSTRQFATGDKVLVEGTIHHPLDNSKRDCLVEFRWSDGERSVAWVSLKKVRLA